MKTNEEIQALQKECSVIKKLLEIIDKEIIKTNDLNDDYALTVLYGRIKDLEFRLNLHKEYLIYQYNKEKESDTDF